MPETIIAGQIIDFPATEFVRIEEGETGLENGDLQWALDRLLAKLPDVALHDDYYRGKHRLAFATEKWQTTFGKVFRTFADNLCPTVVDATANRLRLVGVRVNREGKPDKTLTERVRRAFERARLDRRAGNVHLAALKHGDAYVIVWPGEDGRARLYINKADKVVVRWSEEEPGQVDFAAKVWRRSDKRVRATLYYRDRIEKYITINTTQGGIPEKARGRFVPFEVEGEAWPLVNDLDRVPVVPFPNNADEGEDGVSELRDVVPIQDALNKTNADMLIAQEFAGYPQRWAVGLEEEIDPETQQPKPAQRTGVERLLTADDPNARFGQFEAADLTKFVAAADSWRAECARVSQTPLHRLLLSGEWPSGEALSQANAPLDDKVSDRMDAYGSSWEDVVRLILAVEDQDLVAQLDQEDVQLSAVWRDTKARSPKAEAEAQEIKQRIGVSERQSLREMGYTDEEIEAMQDEADENQADVAAAAIAQFDRGGATGFEQPQAPTSTPATEVIAATTGG